MIEHADGTLELGHQDLVLLARRAGWLARAMDDAEAQWAGFPDWLMTEAQLQCLCQQALRVED